MMGHELNIVNMMNNNEDSDDSDLEEYKIDNVEKTDLRHSSGEQVCIPIHCQLPSSNTPLHVLIYTSIYIYNNISYYSVTDVWTT